MKRTVPQAFDTQLLQRVSLIRVRMGLEPLPLTISVSEIDPLLQFFLSKDAYEDGVGSGIILQQEPWLSMIEWGEKWKLKPGDDWGKWDKLNLVELSAYAKNER